MGGHDDEDLPYVVNKQKHDEELKNQLNDSSHWCEQEATGNKAKWVKEGQNQLRRVAENQQDQDHNCNISQNGNKEDFPQQISTQEEQQGNQEQTKSPKIVLSPGLSQEESKNILNEPLLIHTLESTEEKETEREEDDKEKEKTSEEDEEASGDTRGEGTEDQSDVESQRDASVVGRNACLLFSNMNGTPNDEESSWPPLSQDNPADSSPNGNRESFWDSSAFETDTDLPSGWMRVRDTSGTYYWHIPTGTTQWEPPSPLGKVGDSMMSSTMSLETTPCEETEESWAHLSSTDEAVGEGELWNEEGEVTSDQSLKEFEGATLRYASINLNYNCSQSEEEEKLAPLCTDLETKCFAVRSLGWVEMSEEDMVPGKSSVAVNNCIRQLSYHKHNLHDTAGIWGEGKDMLMVPMGHGTRYYLLFSLLCLCRLKTMLYEYKLREKIHNLKKRETSVESAVTPEYTYMYLGSKRSSSQGRSITSDLLHQAAVVMCLIAFIIIQIMNITVSQQSRESQSEEKQGSV